VYELPKFSQMNIEDGSNVICCYTSRADRIATADPESRIPSSNTGFKRFAGVTVSTAGRLYGQGASNRRASGMHGPPSDSPSRRD